MKNILLVIALLFAALPCTHAVEHHTSTFFSDISDQFSAVHSCECHSCEHGSVCTEPIEVVQDYTASFAIAPAPSPMMQLFVLNQSRAMVASPPPPVHGPPVGHKIIQLLI